MTASPLFRLSHDFAALFGGELHGGRLIQPAATHANDARGLVFRDADCVAGDEQQDHDIRSI